MDKGEFPLKIFGNVRRHIPHGLFIKATGVVPPPPPYVIAATEFSTVEQLSVSYNATDGPSSISELFMIAAGGLTPDAGNIVVTPSSNIEFWDGSAWTSSPSNIAYTDSGISTSIIYGVRLVAGLNAGTYSETLTLSAGDAPDWVIEVTGTVVGVPEERMYDYYHFV